MAITTMSSQLHFCLLSDNMHLALCMIRLKCAIYAIFWL